MNNTYNIKDAASEICRNIVDGRTRFTVKTDIGNILIDVNTDGFGQFETLKFAKFDDVKKNAHAICHDRLCWISTDSI